MGGELMNVTHEVLPEGESTENWAFRNPGFMGTLKQITHCARCGKYLPISGKAQRRHYLDIGKKTFHVLCDGCYEALPE